MSVGLSDRFGHFLPPDQKTIRKAVVSGLVVIDTNVLLSAYRFAPTAREQLLSAMERVGDRLWIPDQVALEFHRNRLRVMASYDAAYQPVIAALDSQQNAINSEVLDKLRELANRAALSDAERDGLVRHASTALAATRGAVDELRKRHGVGDLLGADPILDRLQAIFSGKVGTPPSPEEQAKAEAEAERRIKSKEPPGYKDTDGFGDYMVWRQTLEEVARRGTASLLFVTNDTKEDWYQIVKGRTVLGRPELILEARTFADTQLVMLNVKSFLYHARDHLNAAVSAETLRQAESATKIEDVNREVDRGSKQQVLKALKSELEAIENDVASLQMRVTAAEEKAGSVDREYYEIRRNRRQVSKDLEDSLYARRAEARTQVQVYARELSALLRKRDRVLATLAATEHEVQDGD